MDVHLLINIRCGFTEGDRPPKIPEVPGSFAEPPSGGEACVRQRDGGSFIQHLLLHAKKGEERQFPLHQKPVPGDAVP